MRASFCSAARMLLAQLGEALAHLLELIEGAGLEVGLDLLHLQAPLGDGGTGLGDGGDQAAALALLLGNLLVERIDAARLAPTGS